MAPETNACDSLVYDETKLSNSYKIRFKVKTIHSSSLKFPQSTIKAQKIIMKFAVFFAFAVLALADFGDCLAQCPDVPTIANFNATKVRHLTRFV